MNLQEIEAALDDELQEYQKKLDAQIDKMNEALRRGRCPTLTDAASRELRTLYRKIVRCLHPDIHPDASASEIELLENAVQAYQNGDLAALRIIAEMVDDHPLPAAQPDAMHALMQESERLQGMLATVQASISDIKSRYPYTLKELLEDPQKVEEKRAELTSILSQYEQMIEMYNDKLAEMLGAKK